MPQAVIAIPDEYTHIRTGQPNEAFEMDVLTNDVLFPQDFQFPLGPLQIKVPVVSPDDSSGSCLAIKNKKIIEYRPNAVFIGKTSCKYTACYVIEGQDEVCSNEVIVDITIEERVNTLVVRDDYFTNRVPNDGRVTTLDVTDNDSSTGNEPVEIFDVGYSANPFPLGPGMTTTGAPSEKGGFCKPNNDRTAILYTSPNSVFEGIDRCSYSACDKATECASAMVVIYVGPPENPAPQCDSFNAAASTGGRTNINVLSRCTPSTGLEVARAIRAGTAVKSVQENADRQLQGILPDGAASAQGGFCAPSDNRRQLVYTPPLGFTGEDRCVYVVRDADGIEDQAAVTINVRDDDDTLQCDAFNVIVNNANGEATNINVLSRCDGGEAPLEVARINPVPIVFLRSEEGDGEEADAVSAKRIAKKAERQGLDIIVQDGAASARGGLCAPSTNRRTVVYIPPTPGFTGEDSCEYVVRDADGNEDEAILTINVRDDDTLQCDAFNVVVNNGETANIDVISRCDGGEAPLEVARINPVPIVFLRSEEGDAVSEKRLAKRAERQGIPIIIEDGAASARGGLCAPSADRRTLVYIPPTPEFAGEDSCEYVVRDADGNEDEAIVTIIVRRPTPTITPEINDITFDVPADETSRVSPLDNDIPAPGDRLEINRLLGIPFVIENFPDMIDANLQRKYRKSIASGSGNGKDPSERRLQRQVLSLLGGTCRIAANNLDVLYEPPNNIDPPFTDACVYEVAAYNVLRQPFPIFVVVGVAVIFFNVGFLDPTLSPTLSPTLNPTLLLPTLSPTLSPTLNPTLEPTLLPTLLPTLYPTLEPTLETEFPTLLPTLQPTEETPEPTAPEPTPEPSPEPTPEPEPPIDNVIVIVQPIFIQQVQCSPYPWDPIYQGFPPGNDVQININLYSEINAGKAGKTGKTKAGYYGYYDYPYPDYYYLRNRKTDEEREETVSEETGERKRRRKLDGGKGRKQKQRNLQLYRWCQPGEISWQVNYAPAPAGPFPPPIVDVPGLINQQVVNVPGLVNQVPPVVNVPGIINQVPQVPPVVNVPGIINQVPQVPPVVNFNNGGSFSGLGGMGGMGGMGMFRSGEKSDAEGSTDAIDGGD